jgi:hypothetical protein
MASVTFATCCVVFLAEMVAVRAMANRERRKIRFIIIGV